MMMHFKALPAEQRPRTFGEYQEFACRFGFGTGQLSARQRERPCTSFGALGNMYTLPHYEMEVGVRERVRRVRESERRGSERK